MGRLFGRGLLGWELFRRELWGGRLGHRRLVFRGPHGRASVGDIREGPNCLDIPPDESASRHDEGDQQQGRRESPKDLSVNPLEIQLLNLRAIKWTTDLSNTNPLEIQLPNLRAIKWTTDLSNTNARHAIPFKEAREVLLSPGRQHKAAVIVNSDHNMY
jgi:hypothetical protein